MISHASQLPNEHFGDPVAQDLRILVTGRMLQWKDGQPADGAGAGAQSPDGKPAGRTEDRRTTQNDGPASGDRARHPFMQKLVADTANLDGRVALVEISMIRILTQAPIDHLCECSRHGWSDVEEGNDVGGDDG